MLAYDPDTFTFAVMVIEALAEFDKLPIVQFGDVQVPIVGAVTLTKV